ncbi:unnamed protein product [Auanema sp. JU1783]|nr:unnamed protein product [Auanema sp. JU1783]
MLAILLYLFTIPIRSVETFSDDFSQFPIYWNLHTQHCYHHNISIPLDEYGILYNEGHSFRGDNVVIFYEYSFGRFPYFKNYNLSEAVNGGMPQLVDIEEHLFKVAEHVNENIPHEDFGGIAVIDFEEWRPLFSLNWGSKRIYTRKSIELVKHRYPFLSDRDARSLAEEEFNYAAKKIFVETISLCRRMRPFAKWGFYGFPYCNYNAGETENHQCSKKYENFNNELFPIFTAGNALFPSIYLDMKKNENRGYVMAVLREALRISGNAAERLPIYAYTKFEYKPYENFDSFYTKEDVCNTIKQSADMGADGLVLWSTSANMVQRCTYLANYITNELGPIVELIRKRIERCRSLRCSSNGKCVTDQMVAKCSVRVNPQIYSCQCDQHYYGDSCQHHRGYNFLYRKEEESEPSETVLNDGLFYYLEHDSLGITEAPLQLVGFIFYFVIYHLAQSSEDHLEGFSKLLIEQFELQSRVALVDEELQSLREEVEIKNEDPVSLLDTAKNGLEKVFNTRIEVLQDLVNAAEAAAQEYIHDTPEMEFHTPLDEISCENEIRRMNESDVRIPANRGRSKSGTHVNIESYQCDARVRRDFAWTGSRVVEDVMRKNKDKYPEMGHQFIGTYSGLTRMYPWRHWETEPSQITIDLYDPKFRPWFVNAETTPKDIIFLIDYSGSVKGPTMHLIKITMMYVMSTLTPNDHFYGVYFNSHFGPILNCHNTTFIPATTANKRVFFERLGQLEERDQAHLEAPLKFSLDVLRDNLETNSSLFINSRSGGHKLIMLFTDGVDEWPSEALEEEISIRGEDPVRIFGFSMGYGTGQLPLLNYLACKTFASYSVVDSIMDVKPQSRSFLDFLSEEHSRYLKNIPVNERQISWTNLYMEAQGMGPSITLSLPVLNKKRNLIWSNHGMAGVAGLDISLAEITKFLPTGEKVYGYVVDHNGILLYHRNLILPKTEVHCIRRSACYDASQVRSKAGSGLRVQYGFSDQRVYRLVGLIDSIPTIDMFELEGSSEAMKKLRSLVLKHSCSGDKILDGNREFYCESVSNTPFTVVIVNTLDQDTLTLSSAISKFLVGQSPLVSYFLSKRDICNWMLDRISPELRFSALLELDCLQDLSLTKGLVNSVHKWASSWPSREITSNTSCEEISLPVGFDSRFFINSFVHSRAQISTFFPRCSALTMKAVTAKFDKERYIKDPSSNLQMTIRNNIILAYKSLTDQNQNRLAVVGVQWKPDYVDSLFRNWTSSKMDWLAKCKRKDCLIVTRSGFVVASSTRKRLNHLAVFDPQLFSTLVDHNLVNVTISYDAQGECPVKKVAPWSSSSNSHRGVFRTFLDLVVLFVKKTFWFDVFFMSKNSRVVAQPSMSGGICRFQRIKPIERCILRNVHYSLSLNISKQMQLSNLKCSRYARLFSIANTHLTLVEVDRSCPGFRGAKRNYPVEPEKMESCDKIGNFEGRKPKPYNISISQLDFTAECAGNSAYPNKFTLALGAALFSILF